MAIARTGKIIFLHHQTYLIIFICISVADSMDTNSSGQYLSPEQFLDNTGFQPMAMWNKLIKDWDDRKAKICICENCEKVEPVLKFSICSISSVLNVTENFSAANKIGEGRFGPVYKGKLPNGQSVAVKRLTKLSAQGVKELKEEANYLAKRQHKNLLRLLGYCTEKDENILIYEYMPNKSWDSFLFDPVKKALLDWSGWVKIIDGIALGLRCVRQHKLHNPRIGVQYVDLKARNILLDEDMNPKISDFEMAPIFGAKGLHANTNCTVGAYGYKSSEYGRYSVRLEEFSFGILLLQILSGKTNKDFRDSSFGSLLGYAWYLWENDKVLELIDPVLKIPSPIAQRYIAIALLCTQESIYTPKIFTVYDMLSNEHKPLPSPRKPCYITEHQTKWNKQITDFTTEPEGSRFSEAAPKIQDLSLLDLDNNYKPKTSICENCEIEEPVFQLSLFSFSSITYVTENFSEANKIGEGRFGPVYKGNLRNGQIIAIKRLAKLSEQGVERFKSEAIYMAKRQHKNLLKLLGYCTEKDENILIYEYMPNKSLDSFLFDPIKKKLLNWSRRVKIIEGIVLGVYYLRQYNTRMRVHYRDLRAGNILLDEDMNPKISDFEMAPIFGATGLHANANCILGTYGYKASEYGRYFVRRDEFAFGVLLLEILSGKTNTDFRDSDFISLVGYAWYLWENDKVLELIDPVLEIPFLIALRYVRIALLCTQESTYIPDIFTVFDMLSDEREPFPFHKTPRKPFYLTEHQTELKLEMDRLPP